MASVYHGYEKGSYKSWKLLKYHICSAIQYFNKWGWVFDKKKNTEKQRVSGCFVAKEIEKKNV